MNRLTIVLATVLAMQAALAGPGSTDENTWTAPPAMAQLQRDPTLTPKGKGKLFVPAMSVPLGNEPNYYVFQDGRRITSATPGRGVLLDPGTYEILIGSGTISQLMRKKAQIIESHSTMMKQDWAALVIDVIDASRTSVSESYELLNAEDGETFGLGFGIEEERGERVRTWLLKPGTYHVVRVGESVTTIRKFSVLLSPGTLTQRNLVVDSGPGSSGDFIGFYPPPVLQTSRAERTASRVTSQTELSGSLQLNTSQQTATDDQTSVNLAVQMFNRTRYNAGRNFASIRVILEQGASKVEGEDLNKSVDRAEVRATYIYRLSERIGPYLRGVVNSNVFPSDTRFKTPRDLIRLGKNGRIDTLRGITEFTTAPSLSPVRLREGFGINSQVIRSFGLNMDLRLGIGARQDLRSDFFEVETNPVTGDTEAKEFGSTFSTGLEALVIMDARLARFVSLDSEFDILMSSRDSDDWFFTWENRIRIALASFINLDIVADIEREETLRRLQGREQVLLRFSRFF
jgi:hypothetical protein